MVTNAALEQATRAVGPVIEVYYIQAVQYILQVTNLLHSDNTLFYFIFFCFLHFTYF